MDPRLRTFEPRDLGALQRLLDAPGIREQFDIFSGPSGAERMLADTWTPRDGVRLAWVGDEPVGFALAIVLPGPPQPWAVVRGAVLPAWRRRGIGRALLHELLRYLRAPGPREVPRELGMSAWQPEPGAAGLADAFGFRHDRWYWLMERPRGGVPGPSWPPDVTVRALDLSDAMLADWNEAYNRSFAEHHRFVPSPIEHARQLVAKPGFRPDGVLLAYRGGRVAGFCYDDLHETRGEVATLGTVPEARGIGLGRALLRWGVAWLERESTLPVTLMVDGDNEKALALYRAEGFAVTRTRRTWVRPLEAA